MKARYMVITVELREELGTKGPARRKEAVLDLFMLARSGSQAPMRVDEMATMVARTMWDEAVLMGIAEE
jgi:hypothetical protein